MIYLAYGSNMDWDRMRERCPSARFLFTARLDCCRLGFTHYSKTNRCGSADLLLETRVMEMIDEICQSGEGRTGYPPFVWGVVYHIPDDEQPVLDRAEGVAAGAYEISTVTVHPDGDFTQRIKASTYTVVNKMTQRLRPNSTYKSLLVNGARYWRLPDDYIIELLRIET